MHQKLPSNRKFGFTFTVIFFLLGLWPLKNAQLANRALLIIAVLLGLISAFRPQNLSWINKKWMEFGSLLQKYVSPIFISVFYLTLFSLIGFVIRLFKRNYLSLKTEPETESYWITSNPQSGMKDQF